MTHGNTDEPITFKKVAMELASGVGEVACSGGIVVAGTLAGAAVGGGPGLGVGSIAATIVGMSFCQDIFRNGGDFRNMRDLRDALKDGGDAVKKMIGGEDGKKASFSGSDIKGAEKIDPKTAFREAALSSTTLGGTGNHVPQVESFQKGMVVSAPFLPSPGK